MQLEDIDLTTWIGRTETATDTVTPTPVRALTATLDHPVEPAPAGTPLPPLWHWLYFLPVHRAVRNRPGRARPARRLPAAGPAAAPDVGRRPVRVPRPMRVGDEIVRTSTIDNVAGKVGRTGPLVFVTVRHEVRRNGAQDPALVEFHDIVYRAEAARTRSSRRPRPRRRGASWQREIVPDDVLLFRYSALTFNGHRIHYDRRYVTEVEGYPGLIVHGPLLATLLLDLLRRNAPDAEVATFRFRAVRPTFDLHPFRVNGEPDGDGNVRLWAQDHEGWLTMDATATR